MFTGNGTVTITESSAERVSGTFELTASAVDENGNLTGEVGISGGEFSAHARVTTN